VRFPFTAIVCEPVLYEPPIFRAAPQLSAVPSLTTNILPSHKIPHAAALFPCRVHREFDLSIPSPICIQASSFDLSTTLELDVSVSAQLAVKSIDSLVLPTLQTSK
jgi:hypothetical protein